MSTAAHVPRDYSVSDPERALKYAIQHIAGDRAEIIEGVITPVSPSWAHENAAEVVRRQITPRLEELGLVSGSGNLDLPGSENWFVPDLAVVPADLAAKTEGALLPDQTLLVVEVTPPSNGETDRTTKRRRHGQYGAPLYLLVDRQQRECTVFSAPGRLGYAEVDGPHPFGSTVRLPAPFDLELDTGRF
ncbi:Uma2 family endonuclease [Kitasatospora sp. YST-16]|uniref:Uma2 family endonuclease n=1 Tax=unclassified Kitasatospora TaxID=2633591 RepID=UPI0004C2F3B6|nr:MULTISPECIES: Uma2 family endonuclease [unclassified Kitasatospora]WAL75817.1 Uma2 family endonuclease [Kitasatospora sp. YST-16]